MSETNTVLKDYIQDERVKGVLDVDIQKELLEKGWDITRVEEAMGVSAHVESVIPNHSSLFPAYLRTPSNLILFGLVFLVMGIVFLSVGKQNVHVVPPLSSLFFLIASGFFVLAVYRNILTLYYSSKDPVFHIWVGLLALCVVAFVPLTVYSFGVTLVSSIFGTDLDFPYLSLDLMILNFVYLLALQVVTYLLAMSTALVHRRLAIKRGGVGLSTAVWHAFGLMFIAALLGVYVLFAALSHDSFGGHW